MHIEHLGLMRYAVALELMETRHREVADGAAEEVLFVVEHPPVVTMGKRNLTQDLLLSAEELARHGVDFHHIDRGGSATVHEPGQVVLYPIVRVDPLHLTVRKLVWILEEAMIRLAADHRVTAARDPINPGVYVGTNKLGAVGIRIEQRVSRHGLALNLANTLETFRWIVPCGLHTRGVTSLERETKTFLDVRATGLALAELIRQLILEARTP